ncbi:AraC family transcriptional regulator ligand-binding domain-containing protein [Nocardia stercoris]|uniref:HTH araC/xylS-type domain-containing protein n=1 Tax=Nocardia stercoris TaxID=2483361 RepID=A0A3M2KT13_9NOCA|nr:AraC family transcriptional regulator ligand-binding domain-containing protein [Nocardia stercoris]RMI28589.1 hypothetical protein EBN03_29720 [Nocardia stercoris]
METVLVPDRAVGAPATTNVQLLQAVLQSSVQLGVSPEALTRECRLTTPLPTTEHASIPSTQYLRAWEVIEFLTGATDIAQQVAERYDPRLIGIHHYLTITAPTLRDAMEINNRYRATLSTDRGARARTSGNGAGSFDFASDPRGPRGAQLSAQFGVFAYFVRACDLTGAPLAAEHVSFRQPAPAHHRHLIEFFRTDSIEFDAPADRVTLRAADLELPSRFADPNLAAVLAAAAADMQSPPVTDWPGRLAEILVAALDDGPVTIHQVAHNLAMSPRSLQRRLAEEGTTWRAELDHARRLRYERGRAAHLNDTERARALGYTDPRSARRTISRWANSQP